MTTNKKVAKLYICEICDYKSCNKTNYNKHLLTDKHIRQNMTNLELTKKLQKHYSCICGNTYNHASSLSKHKKNCKVANKNEENIENTNDKSSEILKVVEIFKDILLQQSENQNKQSEQQNKLIQEIIPKIGNITNNTQNNFNINMFLNEKCKDAMNIDDFIELIEFTDDDMMDSKINGIENTLNNMIINKLNDIDVYSRPIHCTDIRRETIYVKENGEWSKKNTKDIIKKMIKTTQNKGCTTLLNWRKKNPDNPYGNLDKHDKNFLHYKKVLGQLCEDTTKFDDRIIKNICKNTYVKE